MLNSQKVEDELNLALDATQSEREQSAGLETGYDPKARTMGTDCKIFRGSGGSKEYSRGSDRTVSRLCDPAGAGKPAGRDHFASAN